MVVPQALFDFQGKIKKYKKSEKYIQYKIKRRFYIMPKKNNLKNQCFGRLRVIKETNKRKDGCVVWQCQCQCGNIIEVSSRHLRDGNVKSCGCLRKETSFQNIKEKKLKGGRKPEDLINKKFGKLTALEITPERKNGLAVWKCQCDCGNIVYTTSANLKNKLTKSCGCIKSFGESNIMFILQQNNINFIKEYNIKINNNNRRFDFAIIEDNKVVRLIEFDGPQHNKNNASGYFKSTYEDLHKRDLEKNEWAKQQNIPLVRIPYDLRDNITFDEIMSDKYLL